MYQVSKCIYFSKQHGAGDHITTHVTQTLVLALRQYIISNNSELLYKVSWNWIGIIKLKSNTVFYIKQGLGDIGISR